MPKSITNRLARRSRVAIAAAGVCASAVVATAGVATASTASASENASATHTTSSVSETVRSQAHAKADAKADAKARARSWMPPITADYTLTAPYAASSDLWSNTHSGQDFAVPSGTTVRAVHGGTVVKAGGWGAGDGPAYGNAIVIRHGSGTYSQYAHLSRIEVSVGEKVTMGERIARSGNTGNTTGPHLHFEIRTAPDYGYAVNPVNFLRSHHVTV